MSTAKTKRIMRRRQKGPLQRRNARRDAMGGTAAGRMRSQSEGAIVRPGASPSLGSSAPSRRLSTPAASTRSQGARSSAPDQPNTGRPRANAIAKPSGASPQVSKRAPLKRQPASRDLMSPGEDISAKAPLGVESAMSNLPPRYDIGKGRKVYAVKTKDGDTLYLPRESEANGLERARGVFIPDDTVDQHERKRRRTALQDNSADLAQRRAQRASKLPGGMARKPNTSPEPVSRANDGTPLWDGFSPPSVSDEKQRQTLAKLRPKYDLGKGRILYPTETAQGKIEYLPLLEDASHRERIRGLYAAFVPLEPLEDFLANAETQNQIARQTFATPRGDVRAFAQEDISTLFEQAPTLVLRSAQLVSDSAREIPELQQQFPGI